ncbi:MAG TPA: nicotinamide riboside transporter PnuC [Povalibacter sp.]|nr:nicotinamide riboside transporter PnuC [Povalibacter sp.]
MNEFIDQLRATSPWEAVAAALGLAYLLLAVRRNLLCWLCAFVSTTIYLFVTARASLYMQTLLNAFYLVMAVVGFIDWRRGRTDSGEVLIRHWRAPQHIGAFVAVIVATLANGWVLQHSDAAMPYVDSFVTWGSVITTWMVARRVIENWLYWLIFDAVGVWLYYSQGLLVTALLFAIYLVIVVRGYFTWRREVARQAAASPAAAEAQHVAG